MSTQFISLFDSKQHVNLYRFIASAIRLCILARVDQHFQCRTSQFFTYLSSALSDVNQKMICVSSQELFYQPIHLPNHQFSILDDLEFIIPEEFSFACSRNFQFCTMHSLGSPARTSGSFLTHETKSRQYFAQINSKCNQQ